MPDHAAAPTSSGNGHTCFEAVRGERIVQGMKATNLKASNLSLVLRRILANPGEITRAAISSSTGITRATISRLVDDLIGRGFVEELDPVGDSGRGRPANRLTPTAGRVTALGIETNVSALDIMLVDLTGHVLAHERVRGDFAGSDPIRTMRRVSRAARRVVDAGLPPGALFLGSGVGIPGLVSPTTLALAPNLRWRDIPLDELLAPISYLDPVVVANEADLAAFAVAHSVPGVPAGPPSFIYVSGEVGVGSGIVVDHRPLRGVRGWSGEIGHICADPNGPMCQCGARGCLESYLGMYALASRAGLDRGARAAGILREAAVSERARSALDEAGAALGRCLAAVINATDIPVVVLGGMVADLAPALVEPARRELEARVLQAAWAPPVIRVRGASKSLTARGAALRVLQRLVDDPLSWLEEEPGGKWSRARAGDPDQSALR